MNVAACPKAAFGNGIGISDPFDCSRNYLPHLIDVLPSADFCHTEDDEPSYGTFMAQYQGGDLEKGTVRLPPGVGFAVGGETGISAIVTMFHFMNRDDAVEHMTGVSGMDLRVVRDTSASFNRSSTLMLIAQGFVGGHSVGLVSGCWTLDQDVRVQPLLMYVHTHPGTVSFEALVVRRSGQGIVILHQDPHAYSGYTHISDPNAVTMEVGDKLMITCTIANKQDALLRVE